MEPGVLAFQDVDVDQGFINEIFRYDVRTLEYTPGVKISQFTVALSMYLIYLKSQINKTKVDVMRNERFIDNTVTQLLTKDLIKEYKTKSDAKLALINSTESLSRVQAEIDRLTDEVYLLDGVDKTISELIASFKRELTRRENELFQTRKER